MNIDQNFECNQARVFRSGNGGGTWTQMDMPAPPSGIVPAGQGDLHFSLVADPSNVNRVYVGGDIAGIWVGDASLAPGSQWGDAWAFNPPHPDSRDMRFDANGELLEADDGGTYRRISGSWDSIASDMQATEIHDVAYDTVSDVVFGGTQDNGTIGQSSAGSQEGIPPTSHVVLVIEENHTYDQVRSGMPWLVSMGTTYGHTLNYHADEPGSLLDYLWLSSGSGEQTFGCTGNACGKPITDDNIFRQLKMAGLTWKVYAQSLPSIGYMGSQSGAYVKRHNPAPWYSDVINSAAEQQRMVPFTQLATDLAKGTLPNYSIIIPDLQNDAHDGTLAQADDFLSVHVSPVLQYPQFRNDGLMVVTFDECDAAVGACNELVYTALIGPNVKRGSTSGALYRHESTLRMILDAFGIKKFPGASATAKPMADFF